MKKSDFHYHLPDELIAQAPLAQRSSSRLLLVRQGGAALEDRQMRDLPQVLQAGDLLVFNDTRVLPARIFGHKTSGGRVEILIERVLAHDQALAQLGASKPSKPGTEIVLDPNGRAEVLSREGEFYRLRFQLDQALESWLSRVGRIPLPPYIRREPNVDDVERYQTVFARALGAVAAPTAGLHFDDALLAALRAVGVGFGALTLHVGAGTFQPMRVEDVRSHRMHSEWCSVSVQLVEQIRQTRARCGRVIAVGTTVVRALESALQAGELRPLRGETRIFIYPGYRISSVDGLLSNFHLPESTLLMLVAAFAGRERILAAYAHAVQQRYRFFSYGDAMLMFAQADP